MIDSKLLKIASNTRFYGLKNNYTYKTNLKNSTCGDKISIEIILKKNTIKELRYETEACIFCQASASTLANIAKNTNFSNLKINLSKYLNYPKNIQILTILFSKRSFKYSFGNINWQKKHDIKHRI